MTMLLIGIAVWTLVALFACSLGRVARLGDRLELERARMQGRENVTPGAAVGGATGGDRGERVRSELVDARRALRMAEERLARLEGRRQAGAA